MLPSFLEIAEKRVRAEERAKLPSFIEETEKRVRAEERNAIRQRLLAAGMSPEEVASIIDATN